MQYEIFDDFKDGMPIVSVPLSWYRRVTDFIKGFGGGGVVKVRTENGSPNVTVDVSISQKADINTEMKPYKDAGGARVTDSPFDGDGENTVSWCINEENANDKNGCIVTLPTRFVHPKKTVEGEQVDDKSKIRMFFRSFAKSPSGITAAMTREIGYKDLSAVELNDDEDIVECDGEADAGDSDYAARADHVHPLNVDGTTPEDVVKSTGTASTGTSDTYSRSDHTHKMVALASSDISYGTSSNVGTEISGLWEAISAIPGGGGTVKSVDSVNPDSNGNVTLDALTTSNYSTTLGSVYQAKSDKLTSLDSNLNDDGTIPVSQVHDNNCDANCLAICTKGDFGHSASGLANSATFGGDWPTLKKIADCFTVIGTGASAALKVLISKISGSASDTNKVVTTNANGELALNDAGDGLQVISGALSAKAGSNITVDENGISVANVSGTGFVKSTSGTLSIPDAQPVTIPIGSGVVKSDGTKLSASALVINDIPDLLSLYAPSSTVSFPGFGGEGIAATASHSDHTHSQYVESTDLGDAAYGDIGTDVQAYSSKLDSVQSHITDDGKVLLSGVQGDIDQHSGNCLVTIDNSGNLGHSLNKAYTLLITGAASSTKNANKIITDKDIGNGLEADSSTNNIKVKAKSGGSIAVTSDGVDVSVAGTGFVKSTAGVLSVPDDQPAMIPSGSGFVKSNGKSLSTQSKVSASTEIDFGNGVTNITTANIALSAVTSVNNNKGAVTITPFPGFGGTGSATTAAKSDHTHNSTYVKGNGTAGTAAYKNVGVSNGVQAYSSKLTTLAGNLTNGGDVPLSAIDGSISGHTGSCLLYVNGDGDIGHVGDGSGGNKIYSLVSGVSATAATNKIITDVDIGDGLTTNTSNNIQVLCKDGGGIEVDATDGLYLGNGAALYDTKDVPTNALIGIDSSGYLESKCDLPTEASSDDDRVLTIKKNGTALSWETPTTSAETGSPSTTGSFPTDEVTQTAGKVWQRGGKNGICLNVMFNCASDGYGNGHKLFVCKLTFSKSGLLTKIERVANAGIEIGA